MPGSAEPALGAIERAAGALLRRVEGLEGRLRWSAESLRELPMGALARASGLTIAIRFGGVGVAGAAVELRGPLTSGQTGPDGTLAYTGTTDADGEVKGLALATGEYWIDATSGCAAEQEDFGVSAGVTKTEIFNLTSTTVVRLSTIRCGSSTVPIRYRLTGPSGALIRDVSQTGTTLDTAVSATGTYSYEVEIADHHTVTGTVTVSACGGTTTATIRPPYTKAELAVTAWLGGCRRPGAVVTCQGKTATTDANGMATVTGLTSDTATTPYTVSHPDAGAVFSGTANGGNVGWCRISASVTLACPSPTATHWCQGAPRNCYEAFPTSVDVTLPAVTPGPFTGETSSAAFSGTVAFARWMSDGPEYEEPGSGKPFVKVYSAGCIAGEDPTHGAGYVLTTVLWGYESGSSSCPTSFTVSRSYTDADGVVQTVYGSVSG